MGQSNNKAQKPNRVTVRKHGWISDSNIKEKRTGARMPGFSFGFGRNRVKRIHLKPEEAEPAGFQPETVRNQSKFSQIFLCCLSSPDDHLDVIQTERISNASNNKNKVTDVVDAMSENQKHKSLALYHPENTSSGFSKENHLTMLTEAEKSSAASQIKEKPEEPFRSFIDGFFENDGWSVWSEEEDDDESAALSSPGMLSHRSWERNMASEQIDKISNATYDINSLDALLDEVEEVLALKQEHSLPLDPPQNTDSGFSKENLTVLNEAEEASSALPEKPEEPSNRFNDGFLENDCWSVMSEGTSVWSEEDDDDESAALSYPGMLRDCCLGKGDMATEQIDLDKISNATYDINSLDALLDEVEEMMAQKEERKNLALYHPQNTKSGFSKENKDDDDDSAAVSYPGILSDCSWEKGDMASEQIDSISNASFDINGLDALLDEVEKMLSQKEDVKLQVKPSNKNNIMDEVIRRTIAEILFAEVDEVPKEQ
ncbi:uncharacterized protein LOC134325585 [Trichomycterus rosablanca]|uniref:uncharacterized protein LOC134325585 n=1 Tax=Trichomycterus rosablanca TaxID=2290929 RepID=UPI002F356B9A